MTLPKEWSILDGPRLPREWSYLDGLRFPSSLRMKDGKTVVFQSYGQYHQFIKSLYKDSRMIVRSIFNPS